MAQRASARYVKWLPGEALLDLSVLLEYVKSDALLAAFALFVKLFLDALFEQVHIHGLDFNDLAARIAVGKHQAVDNVVKI